MKLTDYVEAKMLDPTSGLFRQWRVMAWAILALLVKSERFRVAGLDEEMTLETKGGMMRHVLRGLLMIVAGAGRMIVGLLGSAWLLALLLLSPLILVGMHIAAYCLARRKLKRRAQLLAEARAGMRTPPQ